MKNLFIGLGIAVLPTIIGFLLPRVKTLKFGFGVGHALSHLLWTKLGHAIENRIELTIIDFMGGFILGARKDNPEKENVKVIEGLRGVLIILEEENKEVK